MKADSVRRWLGAGWLAALAIGSVACGGAPAVKNETRAAAQPPPTGGRIRGVITLRGTPPAPRSEINTKDPHVCGETVPVTRLSLGPGNAVRQTFVYLDNVAATTATETTRGRAAIQVEQRHCEYGPHVMALAPGTDVEIVNSDPVLHNVHARETTADGPLTVFNIAQPVMGQRTKLEAPLKKRGVVALTCEAGHPWMTAYLLVADHPFVATTNDNGEFVIDHVPPGTYPIRMWHEGVRLTRVIPSLQQYEYESPYETTQQVTVPARGEVVVNFELELRPAS